MKKLIILSSILTISLFTWAQPDWVMSGAPIGDTSTYLYPSGGWTGATQLTLQHSNNEDSLRVFNMSGTPDGVHIYRVDELPNVICAVSTIPGNDRYFGIFVVNGTTPAYDLTYFYGGNPYVTAAIEPNLDLGERPTNADTVCPAWSLMGAALDVVNDELDDFTLSNRREVILTTTIPLPIELGAFDVHCMNDNEAIAITWLTVSELNNDYFTLERSRDGQYFEAIAEIDGQGTSTTPMTYQFVDENYSHGLIYYRLKQTDFDGNFSYSATKVVSCSEAPSALLYPNPNDGNFTLYFGDVKGKTNVSIHNAVGKLVWNQELNVTPSEIGTQVQTEGLVPGMYTVWITNDDVQEVLKLQIAQ